MEKLSVPTGSFTATVESSRCELVSSKDISFLEGKLKTFIDSLGFEKDRVWAVKDMANIVLWDWFNYITDYKTDHLEEKKKWYKERK